MMLKKLRSFLIALLLAPALTLNANAFTSDADTDVFTPQQQSLCWVYYLGRWWLLPC